MSEIKIQKQLKTNLKIDSIKYHSFVAIIAQYL